jgi:hypothetical protein|tara:strand:- start:2614 stop:2823 length:210 start_codon:yes stop_codon:yes gene_type:complete
MNYKNNLNHNIYARVDGKTILLTPGQEVKAKEALINSGLDLVEIPISDPKPKTTKPLKKDEPKSSTAKN